MGPWGLALKPVHAAVKLDVTATPPLESRSGLASVPVRASPGPFVGDVPAVGEAGISDLYERPPKSTELRPVLADLGPG